MGCFTIIDNRHPYDKGIPVETGIPPWLPLKVNHAIVEEVLLQKRMQAERIEREKRGVYCYIDSDCTMAHPLLPLPPSRTVSQLLR